MRALEDAWREVEERAPAMPITPHLERHFTSGKTVRDVVIGMSDGLTVPFALAAGLSGAVASTGITRPRPRLSCL
jgi:hypothetical protein